MRSSAAVMFRRVASKSTKDRVSNESKELFLTLPNDIKLPIRAGLLQCLATEQVPSVRNKVGDAIAEVARQYTDNCKRQGMFIFRGIPANTISLSRDMAGAIRCSLLSQPISGPNCERMCLSNLRYYTGHH